MTTQHGSRVVYMLKHPVELKNTQDEVIETISELGLRRLKARDMRSLDNAKGSGSMTLAMLAASADLAPTTIDLLDMEDATAAMSFITDFLGGSLPNGVQ